MVVAILKGNEAARVDANNANETAQPANTQPGNAVSASRIGRLKPEEESQCLGFRSRTHLLDGPLTLWQHSKK